MDHQETSSGRYVERQGDDGAVTIYDTENENAWIRSDYSVSVG